VAASPLAEFPQMLLKGKGITLCILGGGILLFSIRPTSNSCLVLCCAVLCLDPPLDFQATIDHHRETLYPIAPVLPSAVVCIFT